MLVQAGRLVNFLEASKGRESETFQTVIFRPFSNAGSLLSTRSAHSMLYQVYEKHDKADSRRIHTR